MKRFGRYLVMETVPLLAAGLVVLLLLLLLAFLLEMLADVLARGVPIPLVAKFLLFKLPAAAGPGLPLALLFAALLAVTRLGQDSEIKAALLLGVSPRHFALPLLGLGVVVSLVSLLNNELLVPWSEARAAEAQRDILLTSPQTLVQEGAFFSDALGRSIFIGELAPGGRFRDVTVITPGDAQGPSEVIHAESGVARPEDGVWLLEGITFRVLREARLTLEFQADSATLPVRGLTARTTTTTDLVYLPLRDLLARIRSGSGDQAAEWTALHRKFAEPAAATAFALFALAVGLYTFRRGANIGFVAVLVLTFVYYATWSVTKLLGAQGALPPVLAGWIPVALYAAGGIALLTVAWRR